MKEIQSVQKYGRYCDHVYFNNQEYDIRAMSSRAYSTASVYVGTYGKYNDGDLTGMWVPISDFDDYDEFLGFCKAFHSDESDPELMYQDFMGFPEQWYCESGMSEHFDEILEFSQLDDDDQEIAETWIGLGHDFSDWQEHYQGKYDSEEDFAQYLFDEIYYGQIPEFLEKYIDYKAVARDLFLGEYTYENGYVFSDI